MPRPICPLCGRRPGGWMAAHLFLHLRRVGADKACWCNVLTTSPNDFRRHLRQSGGWQPHYLQHALNIGG